MLIEKKIVIWNDEEKKEKESRRKLKKMFTIEVADCQYNRAN